MLLKTEQNAALRDIEVAITYPVHNKTVERILTLLKSVDTQIECFTEDRVKLVNVSDICYVESVDRKTIVCCGNEYYQVKSRLYQIYEKLKSYGFVQISKYCIINSNKLVEVKPLVNSHLEAVLTNGMCLYVTRKYLAGLRRILQENE
jgi:DNA-binding LytR/AlgR family response regulator